MRGAYRIPNNMFPVVQRFLSQETAANTPITEMVVNSIIASPNEGQRFRMGEMVEVRGVAWDGGYGITRVEISIDGGMSWRDGNAWARRRPLRVPRLHLRLYAPMRPARGASWPRRSTASARRKWTR